MLDKNSIRVRVAVVVLAALLSSLGSFGYYLSTQIRRINERDETAKLQNINQLVLNMIAQTDLTLKGQIESWS